MSCALLAVSIQVLAEQVKSWRNAQVHHHHVGALGQVVFHGRGGGGNVILRQARAIVIHINGERLVLRLLVPGHEVAAHNLVSQSALPFKLDLHSRGFLGISTLEHELMQQVIVLRSERQLLRHLAIEQHLHRAANVSRTFLCGQQQRPQSHDGGLRGSPCS